MTISWCVTVCNELKEITNLVNFLQLYINPNDEIVVQYDEGGVTDAVLSYLKIADKMEARMKVVGFPLNNDFATFKNNLTVHCTKDYIAQIDADEIPHQNLVERLGQVLETNTVDLVFLPRINTVNGITEKHVNKWGWNISKLETQIGEKEMDTGSEEYKYLKKLDFIINEPYDGQIEYYKPIINAWDYQTRVYRRTDDIVWVGKVHERITGYNNFSNFPAKEEWSLFHHKDIDRQTRQNEKYSKMIENKL